MVWENYLETNLNDGLDKAAMHVTSQHVAPTSSLLRCVIPYFKSGIHTDSFYSGNVHILS